MKTIVVAFLMSAALVGCGGKSKTTTMPDNKTDSTDQTPDGTGGTTYGGNAYGGAAETPPDDPCAGE